MNEESEKMSQEGGGGVGSANQWLLISCEGKRGREWKDEGKGEIYRFLCIIHRAASGWSKKKVWKKSIFITKKKYEKKYRTKKKYKKSIGRKKSIKKKYKLQNVLELY